jgi:hypothetical protein
MMMMMEFRPHSRTGLWLAFLLFFSLNTTSAVNLTTNNYLAMTCLALVMAIHSVWFATKPLITFSTNDNARELVGKLCAVIPQAMTNPSNSLSTTTIPADSSIVMEKFTLIETSMLAFGLCGLLLPVLGISPMLIIPLLGFWAYVVSLPRLFVQFKKSFSFGEGCLVLQGVIAFCVKCSLNILSDEHDPSTVQGSFSIIANIGLGSLCLLCLTAYIPHLRLMHNSSLFYIFGT